jgi:hypothetical protein
MPLLHHADMPAVDFHALEAAKPKRADGEEEEHRFIQIGRWRYCNKIQ